MNEARRHQSWVAMDSEQEQVACKRLFGSGESAPAPRQVLTWILRLGGSGRLQSHAALQAPLDCFYKTEVGQKLAQHHQPSARDWQHLLTEVPAEGCSGKWQTVQQLLLLFLDMAP
mmetsp:Transcript_25494/g.58810  ORF Transcript_25494/g.58810 Transcript_25494/m.58810 type:complete len:116 (+) Transcript_25494:712-1059(+)